MKRSRLLTAVLCSAMLIGSASIPVMADATKVVTLGADLTDAQRQTMMNYFKANANEVQILYVTNQDERNHLGAYVPLAQIGTRTLSCAYVKPTQSGGIRVRTANLNYVTGNMIASTLSTSGINNCEVIAACPFEVSGTGALTGIQMAYETASGTKLDPVKKDLAAKEIVVTGNVANQCGNNDATKLINAAKMQVIQNDVHNTQEIYNIVNNICIQNNINITENNVYEVVELLEDISEQDYDYEDIEETLQIVAENTEKVDSYESGEPAEDVSAVTETEPEPEPDPDSILNDIDESALGENVPTSSTEDPSLEAETYDPSVEMGEDASPAQPETPTDETGIPVGEEVVFNPDGSEAPAEQPDSGTVVDALPVDGFGGNTEETFFEDQPVDGVQPADQPVDGVQPADQPVDGVQPADQPVDGVQPADQPVDGVQPADQPVDGVQPADQPVYEEPAEEYPQQEEYQQPEETYTDSSEQPETEAVPAETADPKQQMIEKLSAEDKTRYESAKDFFKGEFEGDAASLSKTMGAAFVPTYTFTDADKEAAAKVSEAITNKYLEVLSAEPAAFAPDSTGKYFNDELNQMDKYLKDVFGIEGGSDPQSAELLKNLTPDDKAHLYADCIAFFEKLYGETPVQNNEKENEEESEEESESSETPAQEQEYQTQESYEDYNEGYGGGEEEYAGGGYSEEDSYEDYGIPEGTEEVY